MEYSQNNCSSKITITENKIKLQEASQKGCNEGEKDEHKEQDREKRNQMCEKK